MTLALYGKSRRRQGVLVAFALFTLFAAIIGAATVRQPEQVTAALVAGTMGTPTGTCTDPANALGSDNSRAICDAVGEYVEIPVTPPAVPAWATDIQFRVSVEASRGSGSGDPTAQVRLGSTSVAYNETGSFTYDSGSDEVRWFLGSSSSSSSASCDDWGNASWTAADLAGLKVRVERSAGGRDLRIDNVTVAVCYGARTINSVNLNGSNTANVVVGQSVTLAVNVTTTGDQGGLPNAADEWRCFSYQIGANPVQTVSSAQWSGGGAITSSTTATRSGTFNAPAAGNYSVNVIAYSDAGCSQRASNVGTATLNVFANVDTDGDGVLDANDQCPGTLAGAGGINAQGCDWTQQLQAGVAANPPRPNQCSQDYSIVLDKSASFTPNELTQANNAAKNFVTQVLAIDPSATFRIAAFGEAAALKLAASSNLAAIHAAIDDNSGVGIYTNWAGGITIGDHESVDWMIVITDGNPNRPGTTGSAVHLGALTAARDAANAVKAHGAHVTVVGIHTSGSAPAGFNNVSRSYALLVGGDGPGNVANGPLDGAYGPNTDVVVGDVSGLGGILDAIAASCTPTIQKVKVNPPSAFPGNGKAEWELRFSNPSASPRQYTIVEDAGVTFESVTGGTCSVPGALPGAGPNATCTVNGGTPQNPTTMVIKVSKPWPAQSCTPGTLNNSATITGIGAPSAPVGGNGATAYEVPADPTLEQCLGTIKVVKVEAGGLTATSDTWNFGLSSGPTSKPDISIPNSGNNSFTGLTPGNYTVTELNSQGFVAACSPTAGAGSFVTTSGTAEDPQTVGQVVSSIPVVAGQVTTVYFTNTGCAFPDVKIEKTRNGDASIQVGTNVSFNIKVTNLGPGTAIGVVVTDTLQQGIDWNTPNGCSIAAGVLTCNLGDLAEGEANAVTITLTGATRLTGSPNSCGVVSNSASVTATNEDTSKTSNNSAGPATVTVLCPILAITKAPFPADGQAVIGDVVGFNIVVTNNGAGTATNVTVSDQLPNTGLVWGDQPGYLETVWSNPDTPSGGCSLPTDGALLCQGFNIQPGQSVTIKVRARALPFSRAACITHLNEYATVSVLGVNTNSGPAQFTITCPTLSITKTANPVGPVNAGSDIGFDLQVSASVANATNVVVTDALPAALGVTWSVDPNICAEANPITGNQLSCTLAAVNVGSPVTIHIKGTTTATGESRTCGVITNPKATATVLGTGVDSGSAQVTVNCPDPSVAKSGNGPVTAGDSMVYTITVTAGGTGQQTVTLTDAPPAGVTWTVGGTGMTGAGNCITGTITNPEQLSCTWDNLNPGDTRVITLTATSTTTQCGPNGIINTAVITSAGDVNTANNEAQATIVVNCPNVTLTKTANEPTTVSAGGDISFTVTATNNGAGAANGFVLYDVFPANMASWTFTNNPDNCAIVTDADPNTVGDQPGVRCPAAGTTSLAANGGSITFTIAATTTPAACGVVENTARAGAANHPGPISPASATATVQCPDVRILKEAPNSTINVGDAAVYTITVSNLGPGTATGVVVTDQVPAGLDWTVSAPNGVSCSPANPVINTLLTCTIGTLAPTGQDPVVITLTSNATVARHCEGISNTAIVNATNDPGTPRQSSKDIAVNCAEIGFTKVADADPVSAGDNIGFTIEVNNTGAGEARNVAIRDVLPQAAGLNWQLSPVGTYPDNAHCNIAQEIGELVLTCDVGNLAAGAKFTAHIFSPTTKASCRLIDNTAQLTTSNAGNGSANDSVTVNCPVLNVEKQLADEQPNPVSAGDVVNYEIVVTISGPAGTIARQVVLKEDPSLFLSNMQVLTAPDGVDCAPILDLVICDFGDVTIPESGSKEFVFTLKADAKGPDGSIVCEPIRNEVLVTATNADEKTSFATINVDCPNVNISKTAFASSISSGDEASFTVQVINNGAGVAKNVTITDDLSGTGLSWSLSVEASSQALADTVDCTANPITGVFICTIPELANGQWVKIHMSATATPGVCGPIDNVALVTVGNDGSSDPNESQPARITVNCPDITVDKEPDNGDPAASVSAGDDAEFVIKVTNNGPGTAKNVTLNDQLPLASQLNWALFPAADTPAECSVNASDVLSCTWPELAPGAEKTVTVRAATSAAICEATEGELSVLLNNTATVAAANEVPQGATTAPNSDTGQVTINCSDVEVEKSADETPIGYFDSASFTINVWNNGPGTAYGVKVVDTLPAGVQWDTNDQACDVDNTAGTITCEFDELEPLGGEVTKHAIYVYSLDGEQGVQVCGPLLNSVVVSASNEPESATDNNESSATIDVECGTIQVVKIDNVPGNTPNLPANWEFVVTGPNGFNEVRNIPSQQGGGVVTIEGVPLGAGYAVTETQAKGACPTTPSDATWTTTAAPGTPLDLLVANTTITFTFTNNPCGAVLDTGALIIEKFSDINGNGVVDGADAPLSGWPITVSGPQFAQPLQAITNAQGRVILPSIQSGTYTVTEGTNPNYAVVGVRVNGGALTASTSTQVQVVFGDEDVVTFYNQPRGSIIVTKSTVISVNNGPNTPAPVDADGWLITVSSVACGINTTLPTGVNGQATFTNLPLCSDYTVSENPNNPASPGYVPVGPTSITNVTPGHPTAVSFTFVNRRLIIDACLNIADCPPATATATPTNTPVPPTNTPTATPTNTPVPPSPTPEETVGGERTPGPASPTPQAPDTGAGLLGSPVAGMNLMLVVMGLTALAIGLTFVSIGRRKNSARR